MPRYNVKNGNKYYVFSSIVDDFVAEFDSFEELQTWRKKEYGEANFDDVSSFEELDANKMAYEEAIETIKLQHGE